MIHELPPTPFLSPDSGSCGISNAPEGQKNFRVTISNNTCAFLLWQGQRLRLLRSPTPRVVILSRERFIHKFIQGGTTEAQIQADREGTYIAFSTKIQLASRAKSDDEKSMIDLSLSLDNIREINQGMESAGYEVQGRNESGMLLSFGKKADNGKEYYFSTAHFINITPEEREYTGEPQTILLRFYPLIPFIIDRFKTADLPIISRKEVARILKEYASTYEDFINLLSKVKKIDPPTATIIFSAIKRGKRVKK